ncbi:cell number regulator 8-like [Rhododendron vialii]|uniref:cell number regulator 8-like n=1 Tax=Rhododendron vialii TaxID=182163 RepID=UPI00265E5E15|nr:cell number regulator 8-like [Rhododendron vialii]
MSNSDYNNDAAGWAAEAGEEKLTPRRARWNTGLFDCIGRNDKFSTSDRQVCLLGSVAPCVPYGRNAERLYSGRWIFVEHCLYYCFMLLMQIVTCVRNPSPLFLGAYPGLITFHSRRDIHEKFNIEGGCEALNRSYGCWKCCLEQEECYDIFIHLFCHACALCQEARELHCRFPDPGFNSQPLLVTIPPGQQTMGRDGV